MKAKELLNLGFKQGPIIGLLIQASKTAPGSNVDKTMTCKGLLLNPENFVDDPYYGPAAQELVRLRNPVTYAFQDKPYFVWGREGIESGAFEQMDNCSRLPVSVCGALMADAHQGYGLPIGGVLATRGAVIPYAVGVDIACRMMLTVFPIPIGEKSILETREGELIRIIEDNTRFGVGANFENPRYQPVMDMDWNVTRVTAQLKDVAAKQLGTSGGGNHFCEFGEMKFETEFRGVPAGTYLALLTHSGSRGPGSKVAGYYSKLAQELHPNLPPQYKHVAWLDMNAEGAEYWAAMELMGEFASANHHAIHESIVRAMRTNPILQVENHHNFAWKEKHGNEELIVHRKGATPAGLGVLGIIPGSMATPGYLVEGKGNELSLNSASHGAGRAMSRRKANESFRWNDVNGLLAQRRVKLISGGLDEVPGAYKDIKQVMACQADLVDIRAEFHPRLVKMADDGTSED